MRQTQLMSRKFSQQERVCLLESVAGLYPFVLRPLMSR